jgi:hypothetical protein
MERRELANPHSQAQLQFPQADTRPKIVIELVYLPSLID